MRQKKIAMWPLLVVPAVFAIAEALMRHQTVTFWTPVKGMLWCTAGLAATFATMRFLERFGPRGNPRNFVFLLLFFVAVMLQAAVGLEHIEWTAYLGISWAVSGPKPALPKRPSWDPLPTLRGPMPPKGSA